MERPNILYFITHDQGDVVSCLGARSVRTPNLDRLAAGGVRFTNHFSQTACCSPARGTLLTGRYAHCNGLIGLVNRGISLPTDEKTLADYLNDEGYHTCHIGLQHERRYREANRYREYGTGKRDCGLVCDAVSDWLRNRKPSDGSFFLNAGTFEVHAPWQQNENYQGRFKPDEIELPPHLPDTHDFRRQFAPFYGAIEYFDECFGRVLDTLDETGLSENTIVIHTTDHGVAGGRAKSTVYDPGLRTCMFIRWPGRIQANLEFPHLTRNTQRRHLESRIYGI